MLNLKNCFFSSYSFRTDLDQLLFWLPFLWELKLSFRFIIQEALELDLIKSCRIKLCDSYLACRQFLNCVTRIVFCFRTREAIVPLEWWQSKNQLCHRRGGVTDNRQIPKVRRSSSSTHLSVFWVNSLLLIFSPKPSVILT